MILCVYIGIYRRIIYMDKKWFRSLVRRRFFIAVLLMLQIVVIVYTLASRSLASQITAISLTVLSLGVCLYIISKRDKGAFKLTWVFTIMLFPLFGGLFYIIFKAQSSARRYIKNADRTKDKFSRLCRLQPSHREELCRRAGDFEPIVRYLEDTAHFPAYSGCELSYLSPGEEMYRKLLEELEKAQEYIFLEFFIVQEGKMWGTILEILRRKTAQGVKVRLIYDDVGCFLKLPQDYDVQLRKMGIECIVFNPFRPVLTSLQNNRDHRKIAVIDGRVAFTGGVNLADEYINHIDRFGHWKDAGLMLKGEAAWSFTLIFLQMWETCSGIDEDYEQYRPRSFPVQPGGCAQPWADSPNDRENVGEHVYLQMINRAKRYVYINTPYLIVDDSMVSALILAAKSGVDVRIVTPHKWDKRLVHMTTRSYYRELIDGGVKIYEYSKGFIHSKTVVADDVCANVGTTNFDFRSLYLHYECGVWMCGCEAVAELKKDFLHTLESCQLITAEECSGGILKTLFQEVLRLLSPLM